jgi:hypothetical protein
MRWLVRLDSIADFHSGSQAADDLHRCCRATLDGVEEKCRAVFRDSLHPTPAHSGAQRHHRAAVRAVRRADPAPTLQTQVQATT